MSRIERAREYAKTLCSHLAATRSMIRVDELSIEELQEMVYLYPKYQMNFPYTTGDIFHYEEKLYKVIQDHVSQQDWKPSELPALYSNIMPDGVIPEWVQPTGSHNAYNTGDTVIFEGVVYESLIDNNTWSPADYEPGWTLI